MKQYTMVIWGFFAVALFPQSLWAVDSKKPSPQKMIRNISLFQDASWDLESGSAADKEEVRRFLLWSEPDVEAPIHLSNEQLDFDVHILLVRMMNACRSQDSKEYYEARYESTTMKDGDFINFIAKNIDHDRPVLVLIRDEKTKKTCLQNVVGYNASTQQIFFFRHQILCAVKVDKIPQPRSRFYYEPTEFFNWHYVCVVS